MQSNPNAYAAVSARPPAVRGPHIDRRVIGTEVEVAAVLRNLAMRGQLVGASPARPVAAGDPRVQMVVRILPAPPALPPAATPWYRTPYGIAGIVVGIVIVLAGLGYVALLVVRAVIAALPLLIVALVVVALVAAGLRRSGVCCPGLHCPGCGHS